MDKWDKRDGRDRWDEWDVPAQMTTEPGTGGDDDTGYPASARSGPLSLALHGATMALPAARRTPHHGARELMTESDLSTS